MDAKKFLRKMSSWDTPVAHCWICQNPRIFGPRGRTEVFVLVFSFQNTWVHLRFGEQHQEHERRFPMCMEYLQLGPFTWPALLPVTGAGPNGWHSPLTCRWVRGSGGRAGGWGQGVYSLASLPSGLPWAGRISCSRALFPPKYPSLHDPTWLSSGSECSLIP